ncbi:hypothetical protein [Isoptericola sediminis]|uniref:Uncharacterized protein n=1 Tax=Isoptericola sediminis TaxID=2733572 RepID=A0A849K7P5_9MICO|nr:hypothetical protein [Isoptericola sediminis]NNU27217.1 hypothetical protein [Isoptericola sediminis]
MTSAPDTRARPAARTRRPVSARRVVVGVLAATALAVWYVTAAGVPGAAATGLLVGSAAIGGSTLATYVPPTGTRWRAVLGCGPCDVAAAATVLVPPVLLAGSPTATMAVVAVLATVFGRYQRRAAAATACPV